MQHLHTYKQNQLFKEIGGQIYNSLFSRGIHKTANNTANTILFNDYSISVIFVFLFIRGRNYEKWSDLGEKNISWFRCFYSSFQWISMVAKFHIEAYILISNLNFITRCVGIVVRTLACHQGDPSSNPSTAKPFCKKLCLENSLKIWLSQIWDKFELHFK